MQKLYVFLSSSTARWNVLREKLKTTGGSVPKRLNDTRWSARADALQSLNSNYHVYLEVLQQIGKDLLQKKPSHDEANSIIKALMKLETGFLVAFWSCVLKRNNMTSKLLQSEKADLGSSVSLLKSLSAFIGMLRDRSLMSLLRPGKKFLDPQGFLKNGQSTPGELQMT